MTICRTRVPVEISPFCVGMAALCFAAGRAQTICLGLGFAALHELGHLGAMALCGTRPAKICLTAAGVRIDRPVGLSLRFAHEIAIAAAGPAINLLLAGLFALLRLWDCMYINLGFALLNLLPVRALDGGRMLYFGLCRRLEEAVAQRVVLVTSLVCLGGAAFVTAWSWLQGTFLISWAAAVLYLVLCC
ncbi:MAG: hypothetical protein LBB50_06570 [Oscillospiraceae bacterium]|jgi:Zn-dependent protease|nr:hypothetical protein [Oscillospiraceae bacterium]